jgi:hypothetical protein
MKLHELFERKLLLEDAVTLGEVKSLGDLIDPKTDKYYTGEISVTGSVNIGASLITKLPVKFGSVGGSFSCYNNRLTSLHGAPSSVGGDVFCNHNNLTSLQGAPSSIGGSFFGGENKLTSLEGIHKLIKKIGGGFYCNSNPIKSGGIGLILIEGLTQIGADPPAFKIIRKYLGQGKKGLLRCQDELIDAGYEEFARL